VIHAAQTRFFVPPKEQTSATVRAVRAQQAQLPLGVAEDNQVLTQQANPERRAIRLELGRVEEGQPVLAHEIAHHGAWPNARESFVLFL